MMWRFLAGGVAALLLATVGILWWTGRAQHESVIPPAPRAMQQAVAGDDQPDEPPSASDKTREERRFARYDKDEDGIITRPEMMDSRRKEFQKLDSNGDGKLAFEEWAIKTSDRFAGADADHSGTLTPTEFATTRPKAAPKARCQC